jgi:hypothetical protein
MTAYAMATQLPAIGVLQKRCKALAVLEHIIGTVYPYYVYTCDWGEDEAALMSNGSGDEWAAVFTAEGAFIRVFDHESEMTPYLDPDRELWPGLLDGLPEAFRPQAEEPAFGDETGQFIATAVLWRLATDHRWHAGQGITFPPLRGPYDDTGPDGTGMLTILLDNIVDRYIQFASEYHAIDLDRAAVQRIVDHRPLTEAVVRALNPEATVAKLRDAITAIGYPTAEN